MAAPRIDCPKHGRGVEAKAVLGEDGITRDVCLECLTDVVVELL